MAKTDFQDVDEYLATFPEDVRAILSEVRAAIRAGAPGAEEVISYKIAAYRSNGWVLYFSGHTKHFSLSQPPPCAAFNEFRDELARYKSSKSAVQFPLNEPVPAALITRMAAFQVQENARKAAEKPAKSAKK